MQVACNRCGRDLSTLLGVSRCARCRIPFCPACNEGESICAACQREAPRSLSLFVREMAARPKIWVPVVVSIAAATIFGVVTVSDQVSRAERAEESARENAARERRDRANRRLEGARARLFDRRDPSVVGVVASDRPCPVRVEPVGELRRDFSIAGSFIRGQAPDWHNSLQTHLLAGFAAEVMPRATDGVGPLERRVGWNNVPDGGHRLTLVVDEWIDPILPADAGERETTFIVGRIAGRALLWDYRQARVVCAGDVVARNASVTLVTEGGMFARSDDPMTLVRVDLAVQGLRAAVSTLRAVDPS